MPTGLWLLDIITKSLWEKRFLTVPSAASGQTDHSYSLGDGFENTFQYQPQLLPVRLSDYLSRLPFPPPPQILLLSSLPTFAFTITPPSHLNGNFSFISAHPWSFFRAAKEEGVEQHQLGPQILQGLSFSMEKKLLIKHLYAISLLL